MKRKQLISIIITGVVIIVVGVTGVVTNVVSEKFLSDGKKDQRSFFSDLFDDNPYGEVELPNEDHIGVLNIVGEIGASDTNALRSENVYNHEMYMDYIDKMEKSKKNKGILLYVDSPGGAVYQTDELYTRIMEYKEATNRPVWAYFADEACSGGYYLAMAADKIYANRNAWTGSIGVIVSLVNCKGLYDKLGIKEIDITSGKNKAMGSAGLDLTKEQRDILQSLVDEAYGQFLEIVAEGRNMSVEEVKSLADGRIYTARQAQEKGLVDTIAGWEEAKADFIAQEDLEDDIEFYAPENPIDVFGSLFAKARSVLPKSETDLAADIVENRGSGVLKYYAK